MRTKSSWSARFLTVPATYKPGPTVAGLDHFHVMGLEATEQLAQIAGIERGATILDAGSGREAHRAISLAPTAVALSAQTFRTGVCGSR
jgi:hypothetical protein